MNNSWTKFLRIGAISFLITIQPTFAKTIRTEIALECKNSNKCPYFFDLFKGDVDFHKSFNDAIKAAGIDGPDWLSSGVSSPTIIVTIKGKKLLLSSVCEPHNCPHEFTVSYDPKNKYIVGMYQPDDLKESPVWFGQPDDSIKKLIIDFNNPSSRLSAILDNGTGANLPIKYESISELSPAHADEKLKTGYSEAKLENQDVVTPQKSSASSDDVDRLTTYATILGRGLACGIDVKKQSSDVGYWIDRKFPPGSDGQVTYLPIFMAGIEFAATQQQAGNSPDNCDQVRRAFSSMPWP